MALLGESAAAAVVAPALLPALELAGGRGGCDGGGSGRTTAGSGSSAVGEMGLVTTVVLHRWKKQSEREVERESGKKIEREREREGMRKCGKAKEIEVGIAREIQRVFAR